MEVKRKWLLMTEISGEIPEVSAVTADQGKWQKLPVLIAALKLKYRSNLPKADQYTAGNVFLNTGNSEDNLHQALLIL